MVGGLCALLMDFQWDLPYLKGLMNQVSYPYRPHRFSSSMRYFPMISQNVHKMSSKFGECVQTQTST